MNQLKSYLNCSTDHGKKDMLPVAGAKGWRLIGGTLADALVARHCWRRERETGVFGLKKEEGAEELWPMEANCADIGYL